MCWHKWTKWKLTKLKYQPRPYDLMNPSTWYDSRMYMTMTTPASIEHIEVQQRECEKCGRIQRASFY